MTPEFPLQVRGLTRRFGATLAVDWLSLAVIRGEILGFLMFLTGAAFPLPRPTLLTLFGHPLSYADFLSPTHAVIALNKIFTLGAGFQDVIFEIGLLVFLTILYFAIAVGLFQRTQMKS